MQIFRHISSTLGLIALLLLASAFADTGSKKGSVTFDLQAVCEFTHRYTNLLKQHVTDKEWHDIQQGKYTDRVPVTESHSQIPYFHIYASNGVRVVYLPDTNPPKIWEVQFVGKRLPLNMQSRQYFIEAFQLSPSNRVNDVLQLGCDARELIITFNGKNLVKFKIELSI